MENSSPLAHPNNSQSIFAALRDVLADLYPEENDARVVVDDAGLDAKQITFSARAQTNWHNILAEAIRQARLDPLLKLALADYAANPALVCLAGYQVTEVAEVMETIAHHLPSVLRHSCRLVFTNHVVSSPRRLHHSCHRINGALQ